MTMNRKNADMNDVWMNEHEDFGRVCIYRGHEAR